MGRRLQFHGKPGDDIKIGAMRVRIDRVRGKIVHLTFELPTLIQAEWQKKPLTSPKPIG